MKKVGLIFLSFIFFLLIFIYVAEHISPLDQGSLQKIISQKGLEYNSEVSEYVIDLRDKGLIWQLVSWEDFGLFFALLSAVFISGFVSIYTLIDKLFFMAYHDKVSVLIPLRRGILVNIFLLVSFGLVLVNGDMWYNIGAVAILVIVIEVIFVNLRRGKVL